MPLDVPVQLTCSALKRSLYATDTYFREGWEDSQQVLGPRALQDLHELALIVFKPEAVVARVIPDALSFLREHGFVPAAACTFRYDRHIIREAWRYQFNIASRERIRIVDMLETATDSLLVLLARRGRDLLPATMSLQDIKGSSIPSQRRSDSLRAALGVQSLLLNYVHTADEPADLVRELAIYLGPQERKEILQECRDISMPTERLPNLIAALHDGWPHHDLLLEKACQRAKEIIHITDLKPFDTDELLSRISRFLQKEFDTWPEFFDRVAELSVPIAMWDLITIGAELTNPNIPGEECVIPPTASSDWFERASSTT